MSEITPVPMAITADPLWPTPVNVMTKAWFTLAYLKDPHEDE